MPKASPRSRRATELAATPIVSAGASSGAHAFLSDAIAGLDVQLHQLANELAREILVRELQRRQVDRKAPAAIAEKTPKRRGRPPKEAPARRGAAGGGKAQAEASPKQLALHLQPSAQSAEPAAAPASSAASSIVQESAVSNRGSKRIAWNRDTVVNALVPYVTKRMEVDTSFLKRHGPKGLVPAAIRFFGRLPAAINVACLRAAEIAKQQEATAQEG